MTTVIIVLIVIIIIMAFKFREDISELKIQVTKNEGTIREKDLRISAIESDMKGQAQDYAQKYFTEWKDAELQQHREVIFAAANSNAEADLAQWKVINEKSIREDAKKRSSSILLGQLTEHLLPFSDHFSQFNFKDARFMGNPIDLIVFDGVEAKKEQITIHFIEIKTGGSALSKKQIQIRDAVKEKRIEWHLFNLKDFGGALTGLPEPPSQPI